MFLPGTSEMFYIITYILKIKRYTKDLQDLNILSLSININYFGNK